jgi:hypothetical protein
MTYSFFAYALNATAIVIIVGGLAGLGAVGCLATLRFGTETAEAVVLFNVSLRRPPVDAKETKTHVSLAIFVVTFLLVCTSRREIDASTLGPLLPQPIP